MKRALISVSDKRGVTELAKRLVKNGYEIISTGGTLKSLQDSGIKAVSISDITGFPECLDGRVKTLHPAVHAGLLARRDLKEHTKRLEELNLSFIDVVIVNLYPFKATVQKQGVTIEEAVENIDIGGPSMLRSAAKNSAGVLVAVDPDDYDELIERIESNTCDSGYRLKLMAKVFRHTSSYDAMIAQYFSRAAGCGFEESLTLTFDKVMDLRYGENPHQRAAFYADAISGRVCLPRCVQLNGKELSFNNINDASGALDLLREFEQPAAVAVKHANPCGAAVADNIYDAYIKAYEGDPISIFGGITAFNRTVDKRLALELVKIFLEIVIAPDFTDDALEVLKQKPNLRVLRLEGLDGTQERAGYDYKRVDGGLLVQDKDTELFDSKQLKIVTKVKPDAQQLKQMEFAYSIVKHVKSNAIVLASDFSAVGIGAGQTNRIWACAQAIEHAGNRAKNAVLASDAFFPFDDCVREAAKAGISAIIQPGGSVRDMDSIKACDEAGIAMVFVGQRHFKH